MQDQAIAQCSPPPTWSAHDVDKFDGQLVAAHVPFHDTCTYFRAFMYNFGVSESYFLIGRFPVQSLPAGVFATLTAIARPCSFHLLKPKLNCHQHTKK